jgi:hypothetical protein
MLLCGIVLGATAPAAPPAANGAVTPAATKTAPSAAPATTQPAESLAEMKARLARLKEEAAALEAKIAAVENPAVGAEPTLITQLNSLPRNLWPAPGEQETVDKISARGKWISANVKQNGTCSFAGKILTVRASGGGTLVDLDGGKYVVWGEEWTLRLGALFEDVKPEKAVDLKAGQTIRVAGFVREWHYATKVLNVMLISAKLGAPGETQPATRPN